MIVTPKEEHTHAITVGGVGSIMHHLRTWKAREIFSHEISEVLGKRHSDVLRGIRRMLVREGRDPGEFEYVNNQTNQPCFNLTRESALQFVAVYGYDAIKKIQNHMDSYLCNCNRV